MKKLITSLFVTTFLVFITATSADARPQGTNGSYWTSRCCTPYGACLMPVAVVDGTMCTCASSAGPIVGNAC